MERDVTRVVRENIEAFNAGDWDRQAETLTPDTLFHGRNAVIEADQAWRVAFPDAKGTILSLEASGNTAVAEIVWEGTHRGTLSGPGGAISATGKRVKVRAAFICTVRDGKIKEARHYFDLMTLLQQIGAVPAMAA